MNICKFCDREYSPEEEGYRKVGDYTICCDCVDLVKHVVYQENRVVGIALIRTLERRIDMLEGDLRRAVKLSSSIVEAWRSMIKARSTNIEWFIDDGELLKFLDEDWLARIDWARRSK